MAFFEHTDDERLEVALQLATEGRRVAWERLCRDHPGASDAERIALFGVGRLQKYADDPRLSEVPWPRSR